MLDRVDQARLEIPSGEAHHVIPVHLNAHAINELPAERCAWV
jgi:hypothetical protein